MDGLLATDAALRSWLLAHSYPPALDALMLAFSAAGDRGRIWLALGIVAVFRRPARAAGVCVMMAALLFTHALNELVVKPTIARPRPFAVAVDVRVIGEQPPSLSFPSGHAATGFAGAFTLGRAWPTARLALWALATAIALSRVYVGVHYPLDVLGGLLFGLACAILVVRKWPKADRRQPA